MLAGKRHAVLLAGLLLGFSSLGSAQPFVRRCIYPRRAVPPQKPPEVAARGILQQAISGEQEPNDSAAEAQVIPLGVGVGMDRDVDVTGSITAGDEDYFQFTAVKGDIIGIACRASGGLDPIAGFYQVDGTLIAENDDGDYATTVLPASSPFPLGANALDSVFQWVAPASADYLIGVRSSSGTGTYRLVIRSRRPAFEGRLRGTTQILFLDFDGATIRPQSLFGLGGNTATLSPLSAFLSDWGLTAADEDAVIDAVIAKVAENLDDLRQAALNGDRDADGIDGHFDYEIRNSRDHPAATFGQPNVSRVVIGGTNTEFGLPFPMLYGIAESIDPGNFAAEETCVVLLDVLSGDAGIYGDASLNGITRDPGATMIDLIGAGVGAIAIHELAHYLGLYHTDDSNAVVTIIDQAPPITVDIGVGPDAIYGTADDVDVDFVPDDYAPTEPIGVGLEYCDTRMAFGFATGTNMTIDSLTFSVNYVRGGQSAVGTVTLDVPAGPGGVTVQLASADPDAAAVPASVDIPDGETSATFTIDTQPLAESENVDITATMGTSSVSRSFRVNIGGSDASGGGGGSGGGCFVATAAYGTPLDQRVRFLSALRDDHLLRTGIGRAFTNTYYANSPVCAQYVRRSGTLRSLVRHLVKPTAEGAAAIYGTRTGPAPSAGKPAR